MNSSDPANPELEAVRGRLDRLENFLRADPNNAALLVDAFESSLRCGEFERAEFHLRHGLALNTDPWGWRLKEGDLFLAQKRYDKAQAVLLSLMAEPEVPPELMLVLQHNLAYIDFQQGAYDHCVQRLASLLESEAEALARIDVLNRSVQVLWLRALHRTGALTHAMAWARKAEAAEQLLAAAAGVASLIALDEADLPAARRWSELALKHAAPEDQPLEALNTLASLKLGENDATQARQLAMAGLQLNPQDGRSWSVLAFADMLAGDLKTANEHFTKSLSTLPEHIGTWHGLGWVQLLQQRLGDAQATFEHALALDRNFGESHGGLAVVLALQEQRAQAQAHIDRALGLDKLSLSAQYAQAILDGETQDLAKFQRIAQRLLGNRPSGVGGSLLDKVAAHRRRDQ